jgi:hypothetical protein
METGPSPLCVQNNRQRVNQLQMNSSLCNKIPLGVMLFACCCFFVELLSLPVDAFTVHHHQTFGTASRLYRTSTTAASSPTLPFPLLRARTTDDGYDGLGEYDPSEGISPKREVVVGDPQLRVKEKERSVTSILKELAAIQQQGPQKYCILGTRHCSYLHQQIIELLYVLCSISDCLLACLLGWLLECFVLLKRVGFVSPVLFCPHFTPRFIASISFQRAYALVLSGNHVYTSGAGGTHAATIRGALRAEREDLLTVVLPQSMSRQTKESQELLKKVKDVVTMPQNDDMSLDVASRICNSYLLSQTDQLISFAFHESNTVIEATKEAKELDMLVTTLYLD